MEKHALIFDVDGTLAETEEAHRLAFNQTFAEYGLGWVWDQPLYGKLLKVSGGKERIRAYVQDQHPDMLVPGLDLRIATLHQRKTAIYTKAVATGAIPLRPGIARLVAEARDAGLRLAIATTTTRANVLALMQGTGLSPDWFETMACSDDAPVKKPDPQAYLLVLERLKLPADACLTIEDSANGVRAARAAGLEVVMTPSAYTARDKADGARSVWPDLELVSLGQLLG
ncbi:HAD-IA family hydrolase [Magnetospirillum sp. 64-120]|uniref:HAD-IA family hydrolase n=1 Tax=Magnetospirillum sp. 64-120 TaxID=1895778 RepID=UPI000927E97C|nr:HAD-IA family hydrolase [Magnetospirillum sp. 64-120]OJX78540.1 MAG: phosphatase [Magnetospirillum sp. 64-120]